MPAQAKRDRGEGERHRKIRSHEVTSQAGNDRSTWTRRGVSAHGEINSDNTSWPETKRAIIDAQFLAFQESESPQRSPPAGGRGPRASAAAAESVTARASTACESAGTRSAVTEVRELGGGHDSEQSQRTGRRSHRDSAGGGAAPGREPQS